MNSLRALFFTLQSRGLRRTLAILFSYVADYTFDIRYGTDTRSWVSLDDLSIDSGNKRHGEMYQPTLALPLMKLFKELDLPNSAVLVDLGCGKARVLLIASQYGVERVRGVDFSPELCRIAVQNCAVYKVKTHVDAKFEIIESDVVDYQIKADENVFFMYNPFDAEILTRVLQNIRASHRAHPRTVWLIYRNAVHDAVLENEPGFTKQREVVFWGLDFHIYQSTSTPHE